MAIFKKLIIENSFDGNIYVTNSMTFNTYNEYQTAYDAGEVPIGVMIIIKNTTSTAVLGEALLGSLVLA